MIIAAACLVANLTGVAAPATAASPPAAFLGTTTLAKPVAGGRTIFVAGNGSDTYQKWNRMYCLTDPVKYPEPCPAPTASAPLRTIQTAVRVARPGDVIAVGAGTYNEAIGWAARSATAAKPIVLQAVPGARVVVAGTLIMKSANYWTIRGLHFAYNASIQKSGQSVVLMSGGTGWRFERNEISGSRGVANLLVNAAGSASTAQQLKAAAPNNYTIASNCIHDNRGADAHGTDHNIYLMSSIYSTGGVIERNLIAGAPRGANIKAAGPSSAATSASPRNVVIRNNTLLAAASGVTIGLAAQNISVERNIIAVPQGSQKYDGAVKTYQLAAPTKNAVKDSLLSGYAKSINEDYGQTAPIFNKRNDVSTKFSYVGSVSGCTARASSATIAAKYGQFAG